jgi:predicted glycogen debranching enzyme
LLINLNDGTYEKSEKLFNNMYYKIENERGLEDSEDHYIPGTYIIKVPSNTKKTFYFYAIVLDKECSDELSFDGQALIQKEKNRLQNLIKISGANIAEQKMLVIAADNFIINKNNNKTIIAGYPWFSDWGRDAFISFEGLTLKTKRYNDAKDILLYFSKYIKNGLIPNYISDEGEGVYNSVDSSLWFIEAAYKYITYTIDDDFLKYIYPILIDIFNAFKKGTINNIYMDTDSLIVSGDEHTQLTWMDSKIGDYIPTPRFGKTVEVNALWYNALKILELLSRKLHLNFDSKISKNVKKSFEKFYAEKGLFDTLEPLNKQIRPNQILSISLSFPILDGDKAIEVFNIVKDKLYTKKGLRTLDSEDKEYKPIYTGNVYMRDSSYHQGIVWPWLLGPYMNAYKRLFNKELKVNVSELMMDDCIGNVCEIYDAEYPHMPRGTYAQAWSVAGLIKG